MEKQFLSFEHIRNNGIKLAHQIHKDGFIPDLIYVSLRGGAYLGNVISEYFKIVRKNEKPILYAAVVAHSYSDVQSHGAVRIDGWTYSPEHIRPGDKILLVDDIFDSGRTINHLVSIFLEKGVPRDHIKIAVHDYKIRSFVPHAHIIPDYYCIKHEISDPRDDSWFHYLSHELIGLSESEIKKYYAQDPELVDILLGLQ